MEAEELNPGDVLGGRFEVVKALGRGGMGVVFLVQDNVLRGPPLVLKMMTSQVVADEEEQALFRREVVSTRSVAHPSVVRVFDYHELHGIPAITMEFLPGGTLKERLSKENVPMEQRIKWLAEVSEGLQAVHDAGIIHRDLKPQNVLIGQDGRARLTDFGIARAPSSTGRTMPRFTPMYAAPEQIKGHQPTVQTDLYSLGAMAFWVLTGQHVFGDLAGAHLMDAHTTKPPRDPSTVEPRVPVMVSRMILRCLQKDPSKRPGSAGDIAMVLRDAINPQVTMVTRTIEAPAPEETTSSVDFKPKIGIYALGGAGAAFAVLAIAFVVMRTSQPSAPVPVQPAVVVEKKPVAPPPAPAPEPVKEAAPVEKEPAPAPVAAVKEPAPVEKREEEKKRETPVAAKPRPEPARPVVKDEPKPVEKKEEEKKPVAAAPPPEEKPVEKKEEEKKPAAPVRDPALAKEEFKQAKAAFLENKTGHAIELLQQAIGHDPGLAEAHKMLGVAYAVEKQPCPSKKHYQRFLALAPNHPTAAAVQNILETPLYAQCP